MIHTKRFATNLAHCLAVGIFLLISCDIYAQTPQNKAFHQFLASVDNQQENEPKIALQRLNQQQDKLAQYDIKEQLYFYRLQAELYNSLGKYQLGKDSATSGLTLAKKLTSPSIIITELSYARGFALEQLGDFKLAAEQYMNGLDVAESLSNQDFIAKGLINMGAVYYQTERYDRSLVMLHDALKIADQLGDDELQGYIYSELGILYALIDAPEKAAEFYRKSYQHYTAADQSFSALNSLVNLASLYANNEQYQKAIETFKEVLNSPKAIMKSQFYYTAYSGLAWVYSNKKPKDVELAYQYILKAGNYLPDIEHPSAPFNYLMDKAYILQDLKRYDEVLAILYDAEKLLTPTQKHNYSFEYLLILSLRSEIYIEQGRYQSAYKIKSEMIDGYKRLIAKENMNKVQDIRMKLESERVDMQKRLLEQQQSLQALELKKVEQQTRYHQYYLALGSVITLFLVWGLVRIVQGQKQLLFASRTDSLTKVANRHYIEKIGELKFNEAIKDGVPLAVMMLDIDHFKQINDELGHQAGDQVLYTVAQICQQHMRKYDQLGRYGGEEFLAILPYNNIAQAAAIAERIRQQVAQYDWLQHFAVKVTISIGVAELDVVKHQSFNDLVNQADDLLYQAKHQGRNMVCSYV